MNFRLCLVGSLILAACGGSSRPAPQNEARFAKLEARLEALEKLAAEGGDAGLAEEQGAPAEAAAMRRVRAVPVAGSPFEGPEHAWVTLIEGYEYACPYCDHVRGTIGQLRKEYGDNLKVVYKHFLVHPEVATPSALAVCAAGMQGKFTPMNELIWTEGFAKRVINEEKMVEFARKLKLKMDQFEKDKRGICAVTVRRDQAELAAAGATGTPTFFVNGRAIQGALPIETFRGLIDEELAKAKNSGVAKDKYYQHVLDTAQ